MYIEGFVCVSSRLTNIFRDLSLGVCDFTFLFKLLFEKTFEVSPSIQTEFYIIGLKVYLASAAEK